MAGELNGIFQWVEMLGEVNVEGVPAMTSVVAQKLKWREDKVSDGNQADALLSQCAGRRGSLLRRAQGGRVMPTSTNPFQTLAEARDAIRAKKFPPAN